MGAFGATLLNGQLELEDSSLTLSTLDYNAIEASFYPTFLPSFFPTQGPDLYHNLTDLLVVFLSINLLNV